MKRQRSFLAKIQLLADIKEIQNVMSLYEYFHVADLKEEMIALFARKTPGVKSANNLTITEGFDHVAKFVRSVGTIPGVDPAVAHLGSLHLHTLTTPVIEVAGDAKTAQGVWLSPGCETGRENGDVTAFWTWIKIAGDFVKEDGQWKIWHYHRYDIFTTPYGQSWTEVSGAGTAPAARKLPEGTRPSNYSWVYGKNMRTENVPAPPTPYETWDDSRACIK
jgi:hypothetical protein